jgi:DNA-binding HxlR family transcriptional regulator
VPQTPSRRSGCPISFALDVIGDRWALLIVRDIVFAQRRYYADFLAAGEGISSNILADRLQRLEAAGVVIRVADPEDGRRLQYGLTDKGKDLIPVLLDMALWGAEHDDDFAAGSAFVEEAVRDREGVIRRLRDGAS